MSSLITRPIIRTPDQRLRVFVSSTLQELADERQAARDAITHLRLAPVMFELGARPHPPKELYRAYLDQSHIFIGIYWQKYGWVAPDMTISGLEDEYNLSGDKPKLIYIKSPAPDREPRLNELLERVKTDNVSYKYFSTPAELRESIENDVAMLLTERFESQPVEPAPSKTAPTRRHSLPMPPTQLIGREKELQTLRDLLGRDDVALVTLTGPGGTGKSRLALQLALESVERFADGAYFVALAPIGDPDLVTPTIGQTLGLREVRDTQSIGVALRSYLRDKQLLLLLDNFEQVLDAAPVVADLLQTCPNLKIIVTSRAPLHLRGEHEFPVAPLALPDAKQLPELHRLSQYAAVQLFIQRALDVKPDFAIDDDNALAVAEICCRLDGLPLAIELAAARIKLLTPQAMLKRLEHHLPLLTGGARDLPVRQQTLRNTIEWSYRLLDDSVKTLFRRLAVFVGGWTLDVAEKVCNLDDDLGADVLDELEALVDNSLLRQSESIDGEMRFNLLETIREYALERLNAAGEVDPLRQRHAQFYLDLAEETIPYQFNRFPESWMIRLTAERDNLRAAIRWSYESATDREMILRLVYATSWFWFLSGHLSEGYAACQEALKRTEVMGRTLLRGKAFLGVGGLAFTLGKYAEARADLEQSISIAREFGDQQLLAHGLTYYGLALTGLGEYEASSAACTESFELAKVLQSDWNKAFKLRIMGDNELMLNGLDAARPWYEDSLQLARRVGDPWLLSLSVRTIALVRTLAGDYEAARPLFEESIGLMRSARDRWGLAYLLASYAYLMLRQGQLDEAKRVFDESLMLAREVASTTDITIVLIGYAGLATARGDPRRAARLLGASDALLDAIHVHWWPTERLMHDDYVAMARARLDEADYATSYAEGRTMQLDEAVAYAQLDQIAVNHSSES